MLQIKTTPSMLMSSAVKICTTTLPVPCAAAEAQGSSLIISAHDSRNNDALPEGPQNDNVDFPFGFFATCWKWDVFLSFFLFF